MLPAINQSVDLVASIDLEGDSGVETRDRTVGSIIGLLAAESTSLTARASAACSVRSVLWAR